jgi:hypothetical protein
MIDLEKDTWEVRRNWAEQNPDHELSENLLLIARIILNGIVETDEDIPLRQSFQ